MYLEIISPEKILFKGEVISVSAPGTNGKFQLLNNHAALISTLVEGVVSFEVSDSNTAIDNKSDDIKSNNNKFSINIKGGIIEVSDNKATILPS